MFCGKCAITSRLKGQKTVAFAPSSLILTNNFLPLNEALSVLKRFRGFIK